MAKRKRYILRTPDGTVSVSKRVYKAYYKMRRREKYLEEADLEHGLVSYHALDTKDCAGEGIITDRNEESVVDIAVRRIMAEKLHLCIPLLSEDDRTLITLKFWGRKTDARIGEIMGVSQQTVSWRLGKVLNLLKKHLER